MFKKWQEYVEKLDEYKSELLKLLPERLLLK